MKKKLTLIAAISTGIVAGPLAASAAVILTEDFADISEWGAFGGSVAALDTETDNRTVLADNGASTFVEIQQGFPALQLHSNPGLASFTVDTVLRLNDPVAYPPKTIFFDLRDDSTTDGVGVFQRLTSAYNSQTGNFTVDEYDQTDKLLQSHFAGVLSPLLPKTDNASDYSTMRFEYDYNTSQFSVSSIIGATQTPLVTFSLASTSGVFDKLRYRFQATAGSGNSAYFIDNAEISIVIPEPGTLGLLGVAAMTLFGLRRRRA